MKFIKKIIYFLYNIVVLTIEVFSELWTRPFYTRLLLNQVYDIGYKSWPIIFVTSAATGWVLTLQFGFTLEAYGISMYVPRMVSLSTFRELGAILTGIILAGRVGAGIAAEVSAMKVSQQIDAIRALGTSPIKRIVVPRVLGALISIPIIVIFSCFVSYVFAALAAHYELNMDWMVFTHDFFTILTFSDVAPVFIKSFVFAYIISITACYYGLSVSQKEEGVGGVTAITVVSSSVMIVISNFVITKVMLWMVQ